MPGGYRGPGGPQKGPNWALITGVAMGAIVLLGVAGVGIASLSSGGASKAQPPQAIEPSAPGISPLPSVGTGSGDSSSPQPSSTYPAFNKITDPCALVSQGTAARLSPNAPGKALDSSHTSGPDAWQTCEWQTGFQSGAAIQHSRKLEVTVRLYATGQDVGGGAPGEYGRQRDDAQQNAGKPDSNMPNLKYGPYVQLQGIGDEGFVQYKDDKGSYAHTGTGDALVRINNAIIEVKYSGGDSPSDAQLDVNAETPLPQSVAQQGAQDAIGEAVKAFAACAACQG